MRRAFSRRTFLTAATASAILAPSARAQNSNFPGFNFRAAAEYAAARRGVSLLVIRPHGEVLFEDYPNAGGPDKGWELASGTKSFTGIIAAAAVQDGLLRLDEPAADTIT